MISVARNSRNVNTYAAEILKDSLYIVNDDLQWHKEKSFFLASLIIPHNNINTVYILFVDNK